MSNNGRELTFSQAINEAIRQEMESDPTVIVMGEDVAGAAGRAHLGFVDAWGGPFARHAGLITQFGPDRVIDTPIAEMGFVGAAVGAAMTGLRPIVEIMFVDLIGCCYDQIMNQAAKMHYMMGGQLDLPMVIRIPYGTRGLKKQNLRRRRCRTAFADALCRPGAHTGTESGGALIRIQRQGSHHRRHSRRQPGDSDGAQISRDSQQKARFPRVAYTLPIGRAEIVRGGTDITLCGIGRMTHVCLETAAELAAQGISAEVVDVLSLAPLDEETICESVSRTHGWWSWMKTRRSRPWPATSPRA